MELTLLIILTTIAAASIGFGIRFTLAEPIPHRVVFRAKSYLNGDLWEGYYIYSKHMDKHFIVQDAVSSGKSNGSISFAHFAEIDPSTLEQIKEPQ